MNPHPVKGSWVLGYIPETGIPLLVSCRNHIFEVVTDTAPVPWGCGRALTARCLVDGYATPLIDADCWHLASDADIARCKGEVKDKVRDLQNALSYLEAPSQLQEFE